MKLHKAFLNRWGIQHAQVYEDFMGHDRWVVEYETGGKTAVFAIDRGDLTNQEMQQLVLKGIMRNRTANGYFPKQEKTYA